MNVHGEKLWNFMLTIARNGQILGLLLGPPCETWSIARYAQLLDESGNVKKGPRPLRDDPQCWGLPKLSLRELEQISVGNSLLLKGLWLCAPVALHGGAVLLEHPAPAFDMDKPSIWRTGVIRLLLREGWLFRRTTFKQGHFGAIGSKPTTLLYANNEIPSILAEFAQPLPAQQAGLIEIDHEGNFRTMKAKEYPSQLCSCFAIAFWRHLQTKAWSGTSAPLDAWVSQLVAASARVDPGGMLRPDYQPKS